MDLSVVVVLVLLTTVGLRVALVLAIAWLLVPKRAHCPRCSDSTLSLVSPRPMRMARLQRRWCLSCGWTGVSKSIPHASDRQVGGIAVERAGEGGHLDRWKIRWDDDDQWTAVGDDEWR